MNSSEKIPPGMTVPSVFHLRSLQQSELGGGERSDRSGWNAHSQLHRDQNSSLSASAFFQIRVSAPRSKLWSKLWGAYPGFRSMKRLGVSLLPPGWDASPSQDYPQQ